MEGGRTTCQEVSSSKYISVFKFGGVWLGLVVLLLLCGSVELNIHQTGMCDATLSRTVRDFMKQHIYPVVGAESPSFNFTTNCPFHPENDRNIKFERFKRVPENKGMKWRCTICRQTFNDENTLEAHLENAHNNESDIRKLVCGFLYKKFLFHPSRISKNLNSMKTSL